MLTRTNRLEAVLLIKRNRGLERCIRKKHQPSGLFPPSPVDCSLDQAVAKALPALRGRNRHLGDLVASRPMRNERDRSDRFPGLDQKQNLSSGVEDALRWILKLLQIHRFESEMSFNPLTVEFDESREKSDLK